VRGQTLRRLNSRFVPQFFQLIKTGSALLNVSEQVGELRVRGPLRKSRQHFAPRTGDALRIGKIFITALSNVSSIPFRVPFRMAGLNMELTTLTAGLPPAEFHDPWGHSWLLHSRPTPVHRGRPSRTERRRFSFARSPCFGNIGEEEIIKCRGERK
jgi:hypothetical protein